MALGHVLRTAKRHGWIEHVPSLKAPYKGSGKVTHRAWFSPKEYKALWEHTQKRARRPPNAKWKWECEQFHDFVLFMANTGLRPDEAARLEFRDVIVSLDDEEIELRTVDEFNALLVRQKAEEEANARQEKREPNELSEPILEIEVRGKRGVGFCKSMPGAVRPFLRLRNRSRAVPGEKSPNTRDRRGKLAERRPYKTEPTRSRGAGGLSRGEGSKLALPNPTDLIFGATQRAMVNEVLDELDLKFDRDGQVRTSYSLRHTYISFRLMEGADIYQVAKNCRTSVEMIEKYYASHIKNIINTSAVNVRKTRKHENQQIGKLSAEGEGIIA
jgi:hypothetical protein